jgi:uncharacterized RDD family membrane protein YckC
MDRPDFYAPPVAPIVPEAVPSIEAAARAEYARFYIRAGARILDTFVEFGMSMVGSTVGVMILMAWRPPDYPGYGAWVARVSEPGISSFLAGLVMSSAYHAIADWLGGATLGKLLLGLRVRSITLGRCTLRGALIRELWYYVDAFFFGLVAYGSMQGSRTQQRFGDKRGKTVVVKARSLQDGPTAGELILGNVVGAVAAMGCSVADTLYRGL